MCVRVHVSACERECVCVCQIGGFLVYATELFLLLLTLHCPFCWYTMCIVAPLRAVMIM